MMIRHHLPRYFTRSALALIFMAISAALMSPRAVAAELGDYLWQHRPLLVFAPTDRDPRLVETMRRIEASRCDFVDRNMVLGRIVADGRDGGEKLRVNDVPDLAAVYAVIDGMPMRGREMSTDPSRC